MTPPHPYRVLNHGLYKHFHLCFLTDSNDVLQVFASSEAQSGRLICLASPVYQTISWAADQSLYWPMEGQVACFDQSVVTLLAGFCSRIPVWWLLEKTVLGEFLQGIL